MILKLTNPARTVELVKRAFFLAYNACGSAGGMGIFQARNNVTEDHVWKNVLTRGDYGGAFGNDRPERPYGDYVFGRMMKMGCEFNEKEGTVTISDSPTCWDYQSWCGTYKTYEALFVAAANDCGIPLEGYTIAEKPPAEVAEAPLPPPAKTFSKEETEEILAQNPINIKAVNLPG